MMCPRLDDHLRTDLSREERAALALHAMDCPDCQYRLQVRREAYALLVTDVPPLTQVAHDRQWRAIRARTIEVAPRATGIDVLRPWWPALAGAGALLVLTALMFAPHRRTSEPAPIAARKHHEEVPTRAPQTRLEPTQATRTATLAAPAFHAVPAPAARDIRAADREAAPAMAQASATGVRREPTEALPLIGAARALLGKDDRRATELAEEVIAGGPDGETEVVALMIAADGWRRRGALEEAERYYRQAAAHPSSGGYLEEALLRRATLLDQLGHPAEALAALEEATRRVGGGVLGPERTALFGTICRRIGEDACASARTHEK